VLIKQPQTLGFLGTLHQVDKDDLSFSSFPWILVGGGFLLALAVGIGLMFVEADRPLRRLAADSVRIAKGEADRLDEISHSGKFGSIARSVNIHIDKLGRDAKSARTNLDQLLGPAPDGSLGTIDLLAGALPPVRPGGPGPGMPPPPSEFSLPPPSQPARATPPPGIPMRSSPPPRPASPLAPPILRAGTAPPVPTPPPVVAAPRNLVQNAPLRIDDDILAPDMEQTLSVDPYFKQIYDQFVSVKKSCNEPTSGLSYEKFSDKLIKNRDDLMAKTGCREVRFTVYVKDGKAALKATPVKE
jgi:hypothetical protein